MYLSEKNRHTIFERRWKYGKSKTKSPHMFAMCCYASNRYGDSLLLS